jgi:transcriptional regulator with XRE-family HTH domain
VLKTPRLRELREKAALSQNEFSDRSGVSRATIADLEAGNRSAQARTVRRLADALGVEPEELYGERASPLFSAPPQAEYTTVVGQEEDSDDRLVMRRTYAEVFTNVNKKLRGELEAMSTTTPENSGALYTLLAEAFSCQAFLHHAESEPFMQEGEGETVEERRARRSVEDAMDSLSETVDAVNEALDALGAHEAVRSNIFPLEEVRHRRSMKAS